MRKTLFCSLLLSAFAGPAAIPANAAHYRGNWCLVANLGYGFVREDCSYRSFEACRAEQHSFGSTAFCRVSGYPIGEPRRTKKNRAKYPY